LGLGLRDRVETVDVIFKDVVALAIGHGAEAIQRDGFQM
jgi:hypothetical protein